MNSANQGRWGDPWPSTYIGTTNQTAALKSCPFCGSTEILTYEPTIYEAGNDASVKCGNSLCGAEVRGMILRHAIARWNRRANE